MRQITLCLAFSIILSCDFRQPYLGMKEPDTDPVVFAPDIISGPLNEHGAVVFSPNGNSVYWSAASMDFQKGAIYSSQWEKGAWTSPEILSFSSVDKRDLCPVLSPDGNKMYFTSMRPVDGKKGYGLWTVEKSGQKWGEPRPLGPIINQGRASGCTVTQDGDLIFMAWENGNAMSCDLFLAQAENDGFALPLKLSPSINSDAIETTPYISPNDDYLLFSSNRQIDNLGGFDLYVSFVLPDGTWSLAKNLGKGINTENNDWFPSVSPDGKYLFFITQNHGNDDVFWVDASVLDSFRPEKAGPP